VSAEDEAAVAAGQAAASAALDADAALWAAFDKTGTSAAPSFGPILATVIVPEAQSDSAVEFPITTTLTTRQTLTFTVPAGYTKMAIVYTAECAGTNLCADPLSIQIRPFLARSDGGGWTSPFWTIHRGPTSPSGAYAFVSATTTDLITALTAGSTVTISTQVGADEAGFGSFNSIWTSALVLWMR